METPLGNYANFILNPEMRAAPTFSTSGTFSEIGSGYAGTPRCWKYKNKKLFHFNTGADSIGARPNKIYSIVE